MHILELDGNLLTTENTAQLISLYLKRLINLPASRYRYKQCPLKCNGPAEFRPCGKHRSEIQILKYVLFYQNIIR